MGYINTLLNNINNINFFKKFINSNNYNFNQYNTLFTKTKGTSLYNSNAQLPLVIEKEGYKYNLLPRFNIITELTLNFNRFIFQIVPQIRYIYLFGTGIGFWYLQGLVFVLFVDACLTDDEPLWEPIEWSLVQTWILFIFIFSWIAENLIVSRYGSYTGRDKRVWMAWYKTFWLLEIFYIINFGATACFVTTPFYFELSYALPFIITWWHWYSRTFFFKFISIFTLILMIGYVIQIGARWLHWKKIFLLVILINIFLAYLLYTNFIFAFFGYLTNPEWYQQARLVDYIQLSHEPGKWGWGSKKRDHFTYHPTRTVFWFKNDGLFAGTFMLFQMYLFLTLFFVYMYWIVLFRRILATKEVPLTYTIYCISAVKQLFYCFVGLYFFIILSFVTQYWRLPIEFLWGLNNQSWFYNLYSIIIDYPQFLISIFL